MKYAGPVLEELRAAADIVDVVSGFVRLKKTGRNFTGLCPFHQEKTPSFNVNAERGMFKCFGCGRGGDVFTFLMEMEKCSFSEAVIALAERYQISLPAPTAKQRELRQDADALYELNRLAARFFYDTLMGDGGAAALEYIRRRGWSDETRTRFGLGLAPDGWDGFLAHARQRDFSEELMEQAGLLIRREGTRGYDRFRKRLMFPIFSASKKVIGFGARALAPDDEPKYLNSPETAIYVKSRVLYGLSHAVNDIRTKDAVIIVEGYADCISLHQAGIRHTVATSGTALTPDQVRIILRYTRNLLFLYDADSAGFAAMLRGLDVLLEQDCDPRVVQLPPGEDPDSFVRGNGAEAVQLRLEQSVSFVDFVTQQYKRSGKLDRPEGRADAVRHIVSLIAKMEDPIRRNFYIRHVSSTYDIYENVLYDEFDKQVKQKKAPRPAAPRSEIADRPDAAPQPPPAAPRTEHTTLQLLLNAEPALLQAVLRLIRIDVFSDRRIRTLLHLLIEQQEHDGEVDVAKLGLQLADDLTMQSIISDLLVPRETVSDRWSEVQTITPPNDALALLDGYRRLLRQLLGEARERLRETLRHASSDEAARDIAAELLDLQHTERALLRAERFEDLPDVERWATDRD